jgi:AraC-like DNA-binding protein/mannose-6-phosphate isomerase-like protein (cupin superfamily)
MEMVPGSEIGLPLVGHIGTLHSRSARRTQTWHAHEGCELLFITEGATAWEFQDEVTLEVTGGHFLVVPSGMVHRGKRAMRRPSSICGVLFNPQRADGWRNSTLTAADLRWLTEHFAMTAPTVAAMGRELTTRVTRMMAVKRSLELEPKNRALQATLRTLACAVILEAAQGLRAVPAAGPAAVIAAAQEYLGGHLREPVPMSALVRRMGFSRSYLFAIFKSVTGMTPNDYYLRLRTEKAQQLLAGSAQPVTAIALETGFSSSQYFSSVFRKYTGQTPLEFRRSGRKPSTPTGPTKSSSGRIRKTVVVV